MKSLITANRPKPHRFVTEKIISVQKCSRYLKVARNGRCQAAIRVPFPVAVKLINEQDYYVAKMFFVRAIATKHELLKWAIPGLFFLYFRLFSTVDSKQMFIINFVDDWIQTATSDMGSNRSTN